MTVLRDAYIQYRSGFTLNKLHKYPDLYRMFSSLDVNPDELEDILVRLDSTIAPKNLKIEDFIQAGANELLASSLLGLAKKINYEDRYTEFPVAKQLASYVPTSSTTFSHYDEANSTAYYRSIADLYIVGTIVTIVSSDNNTLDKTFITEVQENLVGIKTNVLPVLLTMSILKKEQYNKNFNDQFLLSAVGLNCSLKVFTTNLTGYKHSCTLYYNNDIVLKENGKDDNIIKTFSDSLFKPGEYIVLVERLGYNNKALSRKSYMWRTRYTVRELLCSKMNME